MAITSIYRVLSKCNEQNLDCGLLRLTGIVRFLHCLCRDWRLEIFWAGMAVAQKVGVYREFMCKAGCPPIFKSPKEWGMQGVEKIKVLTIYEFRILSDSPPENSGEAPSH